MLLNKEKSVEIFEICKFECKTASDWLNHTVHIKYIVCVQKSVEISKICKFECNTTPDWLGLKCWYKK